MLTYGNGVSWLRTANAGASYEVYLTVVGGKFYDYAPTEYAVRPRFSY